MVRYLIRLLFTFAVTGALIITKSLLVPSVGNYSFSYRRRYGVGLPGMFMVIPYLAMLKIVCENVPSLKPIGYLLGTRGTERYTITIKTMKKWASWSDG